MKNTGMNRELDQLGRVVIPKELRTIMDLPHEAPMEFLVDNNAIVLRKY
jgi:AbrB family transcriptional regulator, transcriptional pleiotropic regulator of transition state genes